MVGGVTLVGDWLMVTQPKRKRYDIAKQPKSDQLIFRQVYINGSGQQESESLYTEGTHAYVYKTGKSGFCIIGDL